MNVRNWPKCLALCCGVGLLELTAPVVAQIPPCVDYSKDPSGCQPSTFDTPLGQMPSVRVNREGKVDPTSSEEDARAGAAKLEKDLHLFRNFEHLHWTLTVPSVRDPGTGAWRGGDLDGAGDGRGLGIAGNCIYVGHANGAGVTRPITIFKIQPNPEKQPPVKVGDIPAMVQGNQGFDGRGLISLRDEVTPALERRWHEPRPSPHLWSASRVYVCAAPTARRSSPAQRERRRT